MPDRSAGIDPRTALVSGTFIRPEPAPKSTKPEADLTRQRVLEGLEAARTRHGGALPVRGPSFTTEQRKNAEELARKTDFSAARIAEMVGVSRATLYRHVDITKIREAS
jgi:DNA invertase Pin-like site-specific DNA recombinase